MPANAAMASALSAAASLDASPIDRDAGRRIARTSDHDDAEGYHRCTTLELVPSPVVAPPLIR
jgi:hypothetical protein